MNQIKKLIKHVSCYYSRLTVLVVCLLVTLSVFPQQSKSAYVGQSVYFNAPDPPSNAALNTSAWGCYGGNVTLEEQKVGNKVYGVKATINSYYTGSAEIRCDYYYYWYDNNGYMHQNNATTYFYLSCKPVNISLSTTYMNLNVGQGDYLEYSLSPSITPTPTVQMYSSNTNVASVNSSGYVRAEGPGDCVIMVTNSAGPDATCSVHVNKVDPTSVYLPAHNPIYIGQTVTLTPQLYPSNAQTTYSWSSNNTSVATVSGGSVTGRSVGTARITVTTSNGLSDYCDIEVYKPVPSSITLNKTQLRLPVGGTETLTYSVSPSYAIYTVTWSSDASDVVSVNNGLLEAKKQGTANITVTTDNGKKATCKVTVPPEPTAVSIIPESLELVAGQKKQLSYSFVPADAATAGLTWQSSNPDVASINQQGVVKALRPGQTTLTITTRNGVVGQSVLTVPMPLFQLFVWTKAGIKTGFLSTDEPQFNVEGDIVHFSTNRLTMNIHRDTLDKFTLEEVLPEHPKSVTMPESMMLGLGTSVQLDIDMTPTDAETSLTWFNDNPEVVSVTQSGRVTGLKVGEANLMVQTSNGLRASCHITVPEPFLRFYVWLHNGEAHGYDLDERPEVTLGEEVFTLTSSHNTVQYQAADVLRFTLQDAAVDEPDGITTPKAMNDVEFRKGTLLLAACPPHSSVQIYDTAGRLVQTATTDGEGGLSLSLASLRDGIYIIKTQNTTLKIQKR